MVIKNLKTHSPQLPTFKSLKPGDVFVTADDTTTYFLKIQESVTTVAGARVMMVVFKANALHIERNVLYWVDVDAAVYKKEAHIEIVD
jgi:hypothetical protein